MKPLSSPGSSPNHENLFEDFKKWIKNTPPDLANKNRFFRDIQGLWQNKEDFIGEKMNSKVLDGNIGTEINAWGKLLNVGVIVTNEERGNQKAINKRRRNREKLAELIYAPIIPKISGSVDKIISTIDNRPSVELLNKWGNLKEELIKIGCNSLESTPLELTDFCFEAIEKALKESNLPSRKSELREIFENILEHFFAIKSIVFRDKILKSQASDVRFEFSLSTAFYNRIKQITPQQ